MKNQMVSTKITRPRVGQCKNSSQKGWPDGELNGRHENNSPKDGESNSKHENITRPGVGQCKDNSPKGWLGGG